MIIPVLFGCVVVVGDVLQRFISNCFAYHYYDQVSLLSLLKLRTLNVILHFCRFSYYDAGNFKEGLEQHLLMDLSTDVPNTCAMINKVTFGILMIMIKYFYDH